jgi:hypothetical protein
VGKYPLPHTLPIAKRTLQLLPHLHTLYSSFQPGPELSINSVFAIENIVENVGRLCGAFPVLAEDALAILLDMASASSNFFFSCCYIFPTHICIGSREEFVQIQLATKALKSVVGLSNAACSESTQSLGARLSPTLTRSVQPTT